MRSRRCALLVISALLFLAPGSILGYSQVRSAGRRPVYHIDATIDYDLLTLKGSALITVPAAAGDPLADASFFLYANASGILDDERRKYIVVDGVRLGETALPFDLNGAVLRVSLDKPQATPFSLRIDYHGVVPRGTKGTGDPFESLSGESLGMLGRRLGSTGGKARRENSDFGLYSYSDGVLSLGAFWYPQLAVRQQGKWVDEEPKGLGDVAYTEASDFDVALTFPAGVKAVTSGTAAVPAQALPNGLQKIRFTAREVRDFAVLMSEDYVEKSKSIDAAGRGVTVEAYATRKNESRLDSMTDMASHALQIYSERFGPYPYATFKVVEGTIRGGAGGMEFSGLTSLAPMILIDWNKQISAMAGLLGNAGLDKLLAGLSAGKPDEPKTQPQDNPLNFLNAILGQQTGMLNSLLEMTIAHEVAHQWWAIAVGSDSQRAPFVDESLTNYSAVLYFEDRYGRDAAEKMIDMHLKTPYSMARMLGEPDAPANLPTSGYADNLQYAAVVYGKGALYYDALRRATGDQAFFAALREYYKTYRGSLAGPRALLDVIRAKAPAAGIDQLYRRWIKESHGDEDIGGASMSGLQDLLAPLLQFLGNPQAEPPARKPQ